MICAGSTPRPTLLSAFRLPRAHRLTCCCGSVASPCGQVVSAPPTGPLATSASERADSDTAAIRAEAAATASRGAVGTWAVVAVVAAMHRAPDAGRGMSVSEGEVAGEVDETPVVPFVGTGEVVALGARVPAAVAAPSDPLVVWESARRGRRTTSRNEE